MFSRQEGLPSDNVESLPHRIARHVKTGQFDGAAIRRGVTQALDAVSLIREAQGEIALEEIQDNFMGHKGLTMAEYLLLVPRMPLITHTTLQRPLKRVHARIYTFPESSELEIHVTPPTELVPTSHFHRRIPNSIASFTGPTFYNGNALPNNGFYTHNADADYYIPFRDTNPSGKRRGAFGLTNEGQLHIMDDQEKWQVIKNDFEGFPFLVGTSHFIKGEDTKTVDQDQNFYQKTQLSYLFTFTDAQGKERTGFAISESMVSRSSIRKIFNDYMQKAGGVFRIGVELEYSGAKCLVTGKERESHFGGIGFTNRRDHYIIVDRTKTNTASNI